MNPASRNRAAVSIGSADGAGQAPAVAMSDGDAPWWARASWPAAPAARGSWSYAPERFDGVSRLLASRPGGVGAICLDGARKARRTLQLPGGAWIKLRLQLHGRTNLTLGERVKIDTSLLAMVVVCHPHDQMKCQFDEQRAPESSIVLHFPLGANGLPAGCLPNADGPLQSVLERLRRAPHLIELPLPAELSARTLRLLRRLAPARAHEEAAIDELDELSGLALAHVVDLLGRPERAQISTRERRRILEARDIVEAHLHNPQEEPLDLGELPRRVGLNRNRLLRGFHVLLGSSVQTYVRRRRMELARLLIVRGDMSVADVAARAGFRHGSNFASAYRAYHGLPPSHERRWPGDAADGQAPDGQIKVHGA